MPRSSSVLASVLTLALARAVGAAPDSGPSDPSPRELRVVFASADAGPVFGSGRTSDAALDLGALSARGRGGAGVCATTRRRILLTVEGGPAAPAFVRLSALLPSDDGRGHVRVAGLRLSSVPRVVAPRLRVGTPTPFDLEVEVPASTPAGRLHQAIEWVAEAP